MNWVITFMVVQSFGIIALAVLLVDSEKWERRYRKLWIEMGRKWEVSETAAKVTSAKLEHCIGERDEWTKTAWRANDANQQLTKVVAANRKTITSQAETIDALMNGDRSCVKGHRYYTGSGVTCPWCGENEAGYCIDWQKMQEEAAEHDSHQRL